MCLGINHKVNEARIRVSRVHVSMNQEEGMRYVACSGVNCKLKGSKGLGRLGGGVKVAR
jgi:hypothetical protein